MVIDPFSWGMDILYTYIYISYTLIYKYLLRWDSPGFPWRGRDDPWRGTVPATPHGSKVGDKTRYLTKAMENHHFLRVNQL